MDRQSQTSKQGRAARARGKVPSTESPDTSTPSEPLLQRGDAVVQPRNVELILEARLRLLELAASSTVEDFLRATLDELEELTQSEVGFCNFLDTDEEMVTAAAWSTRTLAEHCEAGRQDLDMRVSQAGVWADCVRERRPVIHNDYSALPHRKGIPPGHGPIVRELVVPVFRGDKIVAVLAVGNKPEHYTERDVDTVSSFADLAWDIAARKKAEAALQESDAFNRRLFDASPYAIFVLDASGHFLDCNQTAVDRHGYTHEEFLQLTVGNLTAPELRDQARERLSQALEEPTAFEWRHQRKDGSEFPVEIRTVPFTSEGQPRIMSTARDLTESKLAEKALQKSEEEFRALFEAAPVGIGVADREGRLLAFNDAMLRPGGYSRRDIAKVKRVTDLYYDSKDREAALALFQAQGILVQHETRFRREDGSPYDVWLSLSHTTFGGTPCIQAIVEDRTEKRRADDALHESEERFRSLSAMASEGIMIHEGGVILDANRAFAEITGFEDADELIGKRALEVIPATPESLEDIQAHMRSGSTDTYEIELRSPDGTKLWADTGGQEIMYRGRQARLVHMRDITETKHARVEHERLQAQLRQAAKMESVGRLAGGVAHDFNNMLAVILGHVELAMEQVDPHQPLFADLEEIQRAANRSADITQQLLAFARRQVAVPAIISLNDAVEGMLDMLRRLIGENIQLVWEPSEGLSSVKIDPSQLDQVLVNLCLNSRDAIAETGTITIATSDVLLDDSFCRQHDGSTPGRYALLSVSDTGRGIEPEMLEHLFEPFFTTKKPGEGTGLGLPMVYGVVKQNCGFIDVTSEAGQGTLVRLYLPLSTDIPPEREEKEPVGQTSPGQGETVLVVEDEVSVLRLTERVLSELNYEILTARTPSEALRTAQAYPGEIDLLVTDVIMPEMNGWELSERLLDSRPGLKTLFVSGYATDVISDKGGLDKSTSFLGKPFTPRALAASVKAMLN